MKIEKTEKYIASLRWYEKLKKKQNTLSKLSVIGMVVSLIISLFIVFGIMALSSYYREARMELDTLTKERIEARESLNKSTTNEQLKNFEQEQKKLANNWSTSENNYAVKVDGKELLINRNNIFVSDNANILSSETKQKVYQMNREFDQFKDGQQLMVITIDSLPAGATIESFASDTFNQLKIGQKNQDNGILYLMSIKERKTRIEVGYGLESELTDAQAGKILDDETIIEDFKDKEYDKGINQVLDQLYKQIGSLTPEYDKKIEDAEDDLMFAKVSMIIASVIIILLVGCSSLFGVLMKNVRKEMTKLSQKEIYYLSIAAPSIIFTSVSLHSLVKTGKVLAKHPGSVRKGKNVLVGKYLYDYDGYIITRDYDKYRSSNNGSSGGGSFGGGSSGGGGASGGW